MSHGQSSVGIHLLDRRLHRRPRSRHELAVGLGADACGHDGEHGRRGRGDHLRQIGLRRRKDIQIISADIARQALEHDLIDELQVFVAPVFLGDGIRIFDVPGGRRYDWELVEIYEGAELSFGRTYRPKRDER